MLEDGLREDQVKDEIEGWLDDSVTFAEFENCEIEKNTEKTIYGNDGVRRDTDKDGFIGRVDFALTIQYSGISRLEHGVGIECKGQSTGTTDSDVMKHGIGQAVIYDQSTYNSYLAARLSIIDSRGIAAARQANIGLIGVTENSIDLIRSNGDFLPYLCEIQYEAASEYATCDYCDGEIDTTPSQMQDFDYSFCDDECLERWDSELNSAFYS